MDEYIYILSKSGKPLMPTKRKRHVKRLLDKGRARIASHVPFVVQLKYDIANVTQPLYGGTDPGRTNIGNAVVDEKGNVVYRDKVETRNKDVPKLMSERKAHRQASRRGERLRRKRQAKKNGTLSTKLENGRKIASCEETLNVKDIINTEAKFQNRKRPTGWLTPTARQLVLTHINMIRKICKFLPVTHWTVEYNKFSFMLMEDGSVRGIDFQNGRLKNYSSIEEYVSAMQGSKCLCCGSPIEDCHHIVPRSQGGSDLPENRAGLCKRCHAKVHKGEIKLDEEGISKKYDALSVLNQAMPHIYDGLVGMFGEEDASITYGYKTSDMRKRFMLYKDHDIDAVIIAASGDKSIELKPSMPECHLVKQFRRHDRQLIHRQTERAYCLDGKAVAKNRHKRFEQKGDSLEEFAKKHPEAVKNLRVKKSARSYNDPKRVMPGAVFIYRGKEYVLTSQQRQGTCWHASGLPKNGVNAKECKIISLNEGLVYMR